MRYSQIFIPTVKEVPSDEHRLEKQLLIRAGMERKVLQTTNVKLPLGILQLNHVANQINKALEAISPQELSYANSSELSDENVVTSLIRGDLKSYKHLPKTFGFGKEVKNLYTFCQEEEGCNHGEFVAKGLDKLKVDYVQTVEGEIIAKGFGNYHIVTCTNCGYAQSQRTATTYKENKEDIEVGELFKDHTPNVGTIEDLSAFYNEDGDKFAKSLLVVAVDEIILAMVPGTKGLSMTKLAKHLGADEKSLAMADDITVKEVTGAECGFAGPIGLKKPIKIYVDSRLEHSKNLYVGANETDYHFANVNYGRDFVGEIVDCLIEVNEGDMCPVCRGNLILTQGTIISKTDNLGNDYIEKNYIEYLDKEGKGRRANCIRTIINQSAIVEAIIAQNNDEKGIAYQLGQGVFDIIVTVVNMKNEEQKILAEEIYEKLTATGYKVLLDDRDERAGMKFNDAELIGIHNQIIVGKLAGEGKVEYVVRGKEKIILSVDEVYSILK